MLILARSKNVSRTHFLTRGSRDSCIATMNLAALRTSSAVLNLLKTYTSYFQLGDHIQTSIHYSATYNSNTPLKNYLLNSIRTQQLKPAKFKAYHQTQSSANLQSSQPISLFETLINVILQFPPQFQPSGNFSKRAHANSLHTSFLPHHNCKSKLKQQWKEQLILHRKME